MLGDVATGGGFQGMFLHQAGPWKLKLNAQVGRWALFRGKSVV